jgi:hypothetical protein
MIVTLAVPSRTTARVGGGPPSIDAAAVRMKKRSRVIVKSKRPIHQKGQGGIKVNASVIASKYGKANVRFNAVPYCDSLSHDYQRYDCCAR